VPPDRFGDRLRIINMGENIGFWKEPAKTLEYFFASPHRDQPIMDNSHLHNQYRSLLGVALEAFDALIDRTRKQKPRQIDPQREMNSSETITGLIEVILK
jgi:hypothetical protein